MSDENGEVEVEKKVVEFFKEPDGTVKSATEIKKERDMLKNQIAILAIREFEDEKERLNAPEWVQSPEQLKTWKRIQEDEGVSVEGKPAATYPRKGTPSRPPKSVSRMNPPKTSGL